MLELLKTGAKVIDEPAKLRFNLADRVKVHLCGDEISEFVSAKESVESGRIDYLLELVLVVLLVASAR